MIQDVLEQLIITLLNGQEIPCFYMTRNLITVFIKDRHRTPPKPGWNCLTHSLPRSLKIYFYDIILSTPRYQVSWSKCTFLTSSYATWPTNGTYVFGSLKHWDRGFESRSRHDVLSIVLPPVYVEALWQAGAQGAPPDIWGFILLNQNWPGSLPNPSTWSRRDNLRNSISCNTSENAT
jgi:hypothetical protein